MDIHTQYNIGDTVWVVSDHYKESPCPACDGGQITGKDGKQYACPACEGDGTEYGGREFIVVPLDIGAVKFEAIPQLTLTQYSSGDFLAGWHKEDNCYPTEAEAQAAADRMNEEAK